jgi:hypothetical protein
MSPASSLKDFAEVYASLREAAGPPEAEEIVFNFEF